MNKKEVMLSLIRNNGLSVKKIMNASRCVLSYLLKKPVVHAYPFILMIEPTNYCNLRCPLCPTGNGSLKAPRGFMKLENYRKIIDECGDYLLNVTLWNFGESFLHKNIYDIIEYTKKKNIFIRMSTNGHYFNNKENVERLVKSRIDNIIISLDGASQETFIKYRVGGNFQQVIDGVTNLIKEKKRQNSKTPFVELQFIIMKHNEHEIEKARELAKKIGVDKVTFKTVSFQIDQALSKEKIEEFMPEEKEHARYEEINGEIIRKAAIDDKCQWLWMASTINWDGLVTPCCYDPNRTMNLGNVVKEGMMKIWNGERYQALRRKIIMDKKTINLCKDCPGLLFGKTLN